jgi:hypothetical protein
VFFFISATLFSITEETLVKSILFVTYHKLPYQNGLNVGANNVYIAAGNINHPARENRHVEQQVSQITAQVLPEINAYDKVVVYIGADGSKEAINLVRGLPAEKVVFVTCECDQLEKRELFDDAGMGEAEVVACECRGTKTMIALVTAYLNQEHLTLERGECSRIAEMVSKPVLQPI